MNDIDQTVNNSVNCKAIHQNIVLLAGNLRGMEHLTGTLLYLKMIVHPNRLPISQVDKLLNTNGVLEDAATLNVIGQQIEDFITF